jgi:uncharacterized protein (TIGR02996 family)
MTAPAAFLDAIRAQPDDDTPRLVYADWLDDRGDASRAEFIRLQCELSRWVPELRRRTALQRRERDLLAAHEADWLGGLRRYCRDWRFERGFPRVTMMAKRFLSPAFAKRASALLAEVMELRLTGVASSMADIAKAPQLEAVTGLDLDASEIDHSHLHLLLNSPRVEQISSLNLANNHLGVEGTKIIREADLRALQRLDLRNTELGAGALVFLPSWAEERGMDWLDLRGIIGVRRRPGAERHVINSLGMEFVSIPAGEVRIGSPDSEAQRSDDEPLHTVNLTRPFNLGVYPVTQPEYAEVISPADSWGKNTHAVVRAINSSVVVASDRPIDSVTWFEAVEFCERLSDLPMEKAAGRSYRLPTEAEWEHACRAGTTTPFHYGESLSSRLANFDGNYPYNAKRGPNLRRTTPVGSYKPNAWGLYDMHGNVWEWCADWFSPSYYQKSPKRDPQGPRPGTMRVLRGGSWHHGGNPCRSAYRYREEPDQRNKYNGFRVVMEIGTPTLHTSR